VALPPTKTEVTRLTNTAVTTSRALSLLVAGGLLLASGVGVTGFLLSHARVLSVQTGSMVPTFRPGDAVLLRPAALADLQPGDIISYRNPHNAAMIITHRLISKDAYTGQFMTQGDNSSAPDPAFPAQQVIGRVGAVAPKLGRTLDYLHTPIGLAVAVYLPAAVIVGAEARRVIKHAGYQPYRAREY